MGSYNITLIDYNNRKQEMFDRLAAVSNTYSSVNFYRSQELVTQYLSPLVNGQLNGIIIWNEEEQLQYLILSQGGGSSFTVYFQKDNEKTWEKLNDFTSNPHVLEPFYFIYIKKIQKYVALGTAGLGLFNKDFTATSEGYNFATQSIAYDSKRELIICFGKRLDGQDNDLYLVQVDPTKNLPFPFTVTGYALKQNYLYNTGSSAFNFGLNHLSYSKYDDMYYFGQEDKIIRVNPDTGVSEVIITQGTVICGLMISENSQIGYYAYELGTQVRVGRFDLSDPSAFYSSFNLGDLNYFVFLNVEKSIVIAARKGGIASDSDPYYIICINKELNKNLTHEKYSYSQIGNTAVSRNDTFKIRGVYPITTGLEFSRVNQDQNLRPLSNDESEIHVPIMYYTGTVFTTEIKMININPVTPYPVVTTVVDEDCHLDDLKCEINIKLAKKSCEGTNREIVGRHYTDMQKDSELLEALLWITTFDCLTCDEIENLRCITSKI